MTFRPPSHVHVTPRAIVLFALLNLPAALPAFAERPNASMMDLHRAPFQLEVTVLDQSSTRDGFLGLGNRHITYRAHVDRVLLGDGIKPGDEISVTSTVNFNMPGSTGSIGDRSDFTGPNGLPVVGDRARLFADGTASKIKPEEPNGWQLLAPKAGYLISGADSGAGATLQAIAAEVEKSGQVRSGPVSLMQPDPEHKLSVDIWRGFDPWKMRSVEVIVLAMDVPTKSRRSLPKLDDLSMGLPFVAIGPAACALANPPSVEPAPWNPATPSDDHAAEKIVDAAASAILAHIQLPADEFPLPAGTSVPGKLAPDSRVLLWGRIAAADGGESLRVPLLWVREIPKVVTGRRKFDWDGLKKWIPLPDLTVPPQRVACTLFTLQQAKANPEIRSLFVNAIKWAANAPEPVAKTQTP